MSTDARLQLTTPSEREIVMTRAFAAPRRLVFASLTRSELVMRWLHGPDGWRMTVCEIDLRVGGRYRFEWQATDGRVMALAGEHQEIVQPERLVRTERYDDDWTGGEALTTFVLVEQGDTTTLTHTVLYASAEARDGALRSGMERGVSASYARLDTVLAAMGEVTP